MNLNIPDFKNFKAKEKWSRIKTLFSAITNIIKKDSGVLKPTYAMGIFAFLKTTLIFAGIILIIEGMIGTGILLIILYIFLGFYKSFFFVKRKALQSILLHQVIINGDSNIAEAKQEYKNISGKMFFVGLADYFVESGKKSLQKRNFLIRIIFAVLTEVWDLLKNFMIPVVAIEKKSIKEAVEDLKILKSKMPEVLIGVLGFDFIGTFLLIALSHIFLIILLAAVGASYGAPFIMDVYTVAIQSYEFSISAILLGFYFIALIYAIVSVSATSVKTVYFTIFYMLIKHPESIKKSLAPKLVQFVEMK